jgi:pimeloyl-ACP methyl ester carboxylesterase
MQRNRESYPIVLVHGSNDGSWVWKRVAPMLRAAGHEVYAPTLSGLADRRHLLDSGIDLNTHVEDVANLLVYEDLSDVILVGHSYAGMVISGVAASVPERLKRVVYLDAYVPEPGQSAVDLWPEERRAYAERADPTGEGSAQPPPLSLFGVTDPGLAAWIESRMTPHPGATYTQPVAPGDARSAALERVFISCTGNPATTPNFFGPFAQKARSSGWAVHEIAAGHLAMLTAPESVAEVLLEIAAGA